MKVIPFVILSLGVVGLSSAFVSNANIKAASRSGSVAVLRLSPEEERAAALSEYLAKAHEEKLRAIRDVEIKKGEEIKELKAQIEELKKSGSGGVTTGSGSAITTTASSASGPLSELSKDELVNKVLQYQQFMQKYVVEAQQQKYNAVKAAEDALKQRFQDQLAAMQQQLLPASDAASAPPAPAQQLTTPTTSPLYDARNTAVAAAAAAGKSRWGNAEVQRVTSSVASASATAPAAPPAVPVVVPPEVKAADHGLRNDGGVGGPTLAERVAMGPNIGAAVVAAAAAAAAAPATSQPVATASVSTPPTTAITSTSVASPLYEKRNARVLAAAAAGKSRWGAKEIEHVKKLGAPSSSSSSSSPVVAASVVASPLYEKRNARVVAAAAAGKSRWGSKEVEHIKGMGTSSTPTVSAVAPPSKAVGVTIPVPPEVVAADHGLRSDGSVGGLTLAERVALGAKADTAVNGAIAPINGEQQQVGTPLYRSRSDKVIEAAAAGKSRWGNAEVAKLQQQQQGGGSGSKRLNIGARIVGGQ